MPTYPGHGITFPYERGSDFIAAGAAFPAIGFVLVCLRGLARYKQRKVQKKAGYGVDDLFSVLAWFCLTGMGVVFIYAGKVKAFGYPTVDASPPSSLTPAQKANYNPPSKQLNSHMEYIFQLCMLLCYGFTKLSILFFYRRIFVAHRRTWFDHLTIALAVLVTTWTLGFFFDFTFACRSQPTAYWTAGAEDHVRICGPVQKGLGGEKAMTISDLIMDCAVLSLPFPVIWQLRLSLAQKLSITAVFLVGLMTILASLLRLVVSLQILSALLGGAKLDSNLIVSLSLYWGMLEAGFGFFASQLPSLSFFFKKSSLEAFAANIRRVASASFRSVSSRMRTEKTATLDAGDSSHGSGVEPGEGEVVGVRRSDSWDSEAQYLRAPEASAIRIHREVTVEPEYGADGSSVSERRADHYPG